MNTKLEPKDSKATKDYAVDWTDWLMDGDTLASSEFTSDDVTIEFSNKSLSESKTTVWISKGTKGKTVNITNTVSTALGRTLEPHTFQLRIT